MPGAALPADDRGLQYGDGVFETVLVRSRRARFLDAHLARLSLGCTRLGISIASLAVLRAEIDAAVAMAPPLAVLKIIMTRGSAQRRGYAPQGDETPRRVVSLWHAPPQDAALVDGVRSARRDHQAGREPGCSRASNISTGWRTCSPRRSRAGQGVFDSLLLDASGNLVSGAMSNVFIVRAGGVATPLIQRCGVAGVMRGIVLRECAVLGIAVCRGTA